MNIAKHKGLVIAGLVVLLAGLWTLPGMLQAGAEEDASPSSAQLEKLAGLLGKAEISLPTAIGTALNAKPGTAFAAEFEVEDGVPTWDILVLVNGSPPQLFEVEIDAVSGKVLEVEEEGDDDDEDHDDDDDDDDDDHEDGDDD